MAKQKFGQRDAEAVFYESSGNVNFSGNGKPYDATGGVIDGPIVEHGGLVKVSMDIEVPATNIGQPILWNSAAAYGGLSNNQFLPVFKYYASIDPAKELNARSNFFLLDVQLFFGTVLTGLAPIGGTTAVVSFNIAANNSSINAWSATNHTLAATSGRVVGAMVNSSNGQSRIIGGQNFGQDHFYLAGSVGGGSPVNLTAGRIRLVLLGYEF